MKKILPALLFLAVACSKSPEQVVNAMKEAACKSDSKTFSSYIDKDAVIKGHIAYNTDGLGLSSALAAAVIDGMAVKAADKFWSDLIDEVNKGDKGAYCDLKIRHGQKNENHGAYIVGFGSNTLNWEFHKNEKGFQLVKISPYYDYLNFKWGSSIAEVKRAAKDFSGLHEADMQNETTGLVELQYSKSKLLGEPCTESAFVFFDGKLAGVVYQCNGDKASIENRVQALTAHLTKNYGQPAILEDAKQKGSKWQFLDSRFILASGAENNQETLAFWVADAKVNIPAELEKREKKSKK